MISAILTRILPSAKYKLVLGPSNWKDLHALLEVIGGCGVPGDATIESTINKSRSSAPEDDSTPQPSHKRQRVLQMEKENAPVRVLCSVQFLEKVRASIVRY